MGKPEAKIEQYLRRRVQELGGQCRKCSWIGRSGAPDQFFWFSGGRLAFAECKSEGVEVDWRSQQGREMRRMREAGLPVYVVSSRDEVDTMLHEVFG